MRARLAPLAMRSRSRANGSLTLRAGRSRIEHDGVDDAEERGAWADGEIQRDGVDSERRPLPQHAETVD